jgi:hypothetical protein
LAVLGGMPLVANCESRGSIEEVHMLSIKAECHPLASLYFRARPHSGDTTCAVVLTEARKVFWVRHTAAEQVFAHWQSIKQEVDMLA